MFGGDIWSFETAGDELAFRKLAELCPVFGWGKKGGGDCWASGLQGECKQRLFASEIEQLTFLSIHSVRAW